jgi:hypothetical protein
MGCRVRIENGKVIKAFAPNGNESKLFQDILTLPDVDGNLDVAKQLWAQVYTPQFKNWFGEWEAVEDLRELFKTNDYKAFQHIKNEYITDPERAAHEIAIQANTSDSEFHGVEVLVGAKAVDLALKLYPNAKVGDTFTPVVSKVVDDNGEPLIVYHGTEEKFDSFLGEQLTYFSTHKSIANLYGSSVIPSFLSFTKIFYEDGGNLASEPYETLLNRLEESSKDSYISLNKRIFIASNPDQIKSVYNRGSYLQTKNDVEIVETNTSESESPRFNIQYKGQVEGSIATENTGEYLFINVSYVDKPNLNIGSYAYLKLAKWAQDRGLTLASDIIATRVSDPAMALWNRFVITGQAERKGDRFYFTGKQIQ